MINGANIEEKKGFYRMKESCPPLDEYERINNELPWTHLERICEDEFLDGTGKTISYGISFQEFEAIVNKRKLEGLRY